MSRLLTAARPAKTAERGLTPTAVCRHAKLSCFPFLLLLRRCSVSSDNLVTSELYGRAQLWPLDSMEPGHEKRLAPAESCSLTQVLINQVLPGLLHLWYKDRATMGCTISFISWSLSICSIHVSVTRKSKIFYDTLSIRKEVDDVDF